MKRAIIHLTLSVHEFKDNELRQVLPLEVMSSYGVPIKTVVHIDGEDENQVLLKIKNWIENAKQG
jgi:phosphotransferase system HPr-like phosphotransfer protein